MAVYQYQPITGPLAGASLEKQTQAFLGDASTRAEWDKVENRPTMAEFQAPALAALAVAENAAQTANAAQEAASNAQNTATNAQTIAETADAKANDALVLANTAKDTSITALNSANTALVAANDAQNISNAANTTANEANVTANNAQNAANAASTTADNAQTIAESATDTANTAITTANTAIDTANTANSTANAANTTAANALTVANTAQNLANNAVSAATLAGTRIAVACVGQAPIPAGTVCMPIPGQQSASGAVLVKSALAAENPATGPLFLALSTIPQDGAGANGALCLVSGIASPQPFSGNFTTNAVLYLDVANASVTITPQNIVVGRVLRGGAQNTAITLWDPDYSWQWK